jgi:hypothetical protein
MFLVGSVPPARRHPAWLARRAAAGCCCSSVRRACRPRSPGRSSGRSAGRSPSSSARRAPRPRERRSDPTAHVGERLGADDRGGLVSAAAVFAASLRDTFVRVARPSVTADYIVTDAVVPGAADHVADTLAALPELSAVSPIRGHGGARRRRAEGDRRRRPRGARRAARPRHALRRATRAWPTGRVLVHQRPGARPRDLGRRHGRDDVPERHQRVDRRRRHLRRRRRRGQLAHLARDAGGVTDVPPRDFFVVARLADGVDPPPPTWPCARRWNRSPRSRCRPTPSSGSSRRTRSTSCSHRHHGAAALRDRDRRARHLDHAGACRCSNAPARSVCSAPSA